MAIGLRPAGDRPVLAARGRHSGRVGGDRARRRVHRGRPHRQLRRRADVLPRSTRRHPRHRRPCVRLPADGSARGGMRFRQPRGARRDGRHRIAALRRRPRHRRRDPPQRRRCQGRRAAQLRRLGGRRDDRGHQPVAIAVRRGGRRVRPPLGRRARAPRSHRRAQLRERPAQPERPDPHMGAPRRRASATTTRSTRPSPGCSARWTAAASPTERRR